MFYQRKQLGPLSSLQAVFRGLINLISSEINPENWTTSIFLVTGTKQSWSKFYRILWHKTKNRLKLNRFHLFPNTWKCLSSQDRMKIQYLTNTLLVIFKIFPRFSIKQFPEKMRKCSKPAILSRFPVPTQIIIVLLKKYKIV